MPLGLRRGCQWFLSMYCNQRLLVLESWNATIDRSKIHVLEWKLLLEMHACEPPPARSTFGFWQKFACRSEEVNDAVASARVHCPVRFSVRVRVRVRRAHASRPRGRAARPRRHTPHPRPGARRGPCTVFCVCRCTVWLFFSCLLKFEASLSASLMADSTLGRVFRGPVQSSLQRSGYLLVSK